MEYKVNVLKLKAQMALQGYNITSLSEKIGVTRNTLSSLMNGKNPSYTLMCGIIDALQLFAQEAKEIFFDSNLRTA